MKTKNWVHLHVHSAYALGAAICRIPALVQRAQ
jgi:DNA polymerase III alpha subunit